VIEVRSEREVRQLEGVIDKRNFGNKSEREINFVGKSGARADEGQGRD